MTVTSLSNTLGDHDSWTIYKMVKSKDSGLRKKQYFLLDRQET